MTVSIPVPLDKMRVTINNVTDFILAGLDIATAALNLVKTFAFSYLDPIAALVQAIVDELDALARSLEGIGIYLAGDWNLFQYPYQDLKGGFAEYERRMIARLTDKTDPTRPDVSSVIKTFGAFFYLSVDSPNIEKLQGFLEQIARFFNVPTNSKGGLPTPTIGDILYGADATSVFNFDSLVNLARLDPTPPAVARVSWKVTPPTTDSPVKPFPSLPPKHFLVTVSTIPDGIPLMFDRPRSNTDTQTGEAGKQVQPREYGPILDRRGTPIVLYGGAQMLDFDKDTFGWNSAIDSDGNVKPGRARVYGVLDTANNSVIPLEELLHEEVVTQTQGSGGSSTSSSITPLFQRTYTTDEIEVSFQWATDTFSMDLALENLPWHADVEIVDGKATIKNVRRVGTYYVRVASTGPSSINYDAVDNLRNRFVYDLASMGAKANATTSDQPFVIDVGKESDRGMSFALSQWSKPKTVTFTNADTAAYLEAVKTALVILILCRVDLTVITELEGILDAGTIAAAEEDKTLLPDVALKATGIESYRHLIDFIYGDFTDVTKSVGKDPTDFRKDLYDRVTQVANDLYRTTGPMTAAEKAVVDATEMLRTVKWSDILGARGDFDKVAQSIRDTPFDTTILGSLLPNTSEDRGVALNPWCIGVSETVINNLQFLDRSPGVEVFKNRKPHFIVVEQTGGSGDTPVEPDVPKEKAATFLASQPSGLRMLYELYVQEDGSIKVEPEAVDWWTALQSYKQFVGSADRSPVYYFNRFAFANESAVRAGNVEIAYCRTLLAEYENGQLMKQAAIALGVAAAAHQRSPQDGEWYSLRIGDVLPSLDGWVDSITNWIDSIKASIESVADTLSAYIDFVQARIMDLQQLVRRINDLLMSVFSFSFSMPKVSGLLLASNGTDGILADFANAGGKPTDSPQAYGAGVVVVAPAFPGFLTEIFKTTDDPLTGTMGTPTATPIFGIEDIPDADLNPPAPLEPDVL